MIRTLISIFLIVTTTSFCFGRSFKLRHPNGRLKAIYHLKRKMLSGEYVAYYRNGKIATEGQFLNGIRVGIWIDHHKNGKLALKRIYENGFEKYAEGWWENGQTAFKGKYQNGVRSESWTFNDSLGKIRLDSNAFFFKIKSDDNRNRLELFFGSRRSEYLIENDDLKPDESGLYYSFSRYMQSADDDDLEWYCSLNLRINGLISNGTHIENWYYMGEDDVPIHVYFNKYSEPMYALIDDNYENVKIGFDDYLKGLLYDAESVYTRFNNKQDSVDANFAQEWFIGSQSSNKNEFYLSNTENRNQKLWLTIDKSSNTIFLKATNLGYDSLKSECFLLVRYTSFDLSYPIGKSQYYSGSDVVFEECYTRINKQLTPADFYIIDWFFDFEEGQMISKRHGSLDIGTGKILIFNKGFVVDIDDK